MQSFIPLSDEIYQYAQRAHQRTMSLYHDDLFEDLHQSIHDDLIGDEHIVLCEEHHDKMYHFLQNDTFERGVYRVSSSPMYRAGLSDWEILFSVADFDEILGEEVMLTGVSHCETAPDRVLLSLSPFGTDAAYTLEFDLKNKCLVDNGFHFPLGKNIIQWRDVDSLWIAPAWNGAPITNSHYPKTVHLVRRHESFEQSTFIFECDETDVSVEAWRYLDAQGSSIDILCRRRGFFSEEYFQINEKNQCINLNIPSCAQLCGYLSGFLLLRLRDTWQRSNHRYSTGSLLAVRLSRGILREAICLFEPCEGESLECVETSRRFVLIHFLQHIKGKFKAWKCSSGTWQEVCAPKTEAMHIEMVDQPFGGDLFYFLEEDLIHAPMLKSWDASCDEICVLRRRTAAFDASNLSLRQYFAPSKDGTSVPYFWCGSDINAPTLIYVYGGFGISNLPYYQSITGKYWLEKGYSLVLANVRGGGEYGPNWHFAAQREYKMRSLDDLLAIIDAQKACKIALQGGSFGAALATAVLTHRNITAVIAEMPLLDLPDFVHLGGAQWIEEMGDPQNPIQYDVLKRLSALHQMRKGETYAPVLLTTDWHDDRVHPAHALRFYEKLRQIHSPVWLYLKDGGGHEGHGNQSEEFAIIFRFLAAMMS